MTARFRLWWQYIKQHPVAIGVIGFVLVLVIVLIIAEVWFNGTGFNGYNQVTIAHTTSGPSAGTVIRTEVYQPGKTLWDWLQLLIIPLVLAVIALLFNRATTRTEQKIATERYEQDKEIASRHYHQDQQIAARRYEDDRHIALDKQREDLLQTYLDRISELLLEKNLRLSQPDAEVRNVARVRTTTVLTQLDARRIGYVFAFLREARLMSTTSNNNVVILGGADFRAVNWSQADLSKANLSYAFLLEAKLSLANLNDANLSYATLIGANLSKADLSGADLSEVNLSHAFLSHAFLSKADLSGADLSEADLTGAIVTDEQLSKAKSLKGATMPDGTKHD